MPAAARRILFNEHRLRSGWRIAIFFVVFFALLIAAQFATGFAPPGVLSWLSPTLSFTAALVAGWIVLARLDGRPIGALGFAFTPATWRETGGGMLVGSALIGVAALLLLLTGAARFIPDDGDAVGYLSALVGTLLFFGISAAWEEVLFRGYPFQALVEGVGAWPATLVASALFSLLHAANPNVDALGLINIFLASILLSVAYLQTRSLWFVSALHLGWNWTMATLFDFPVSGLVFDTPLYSARETGADWWTGGPFGPEAGLAGTVVIVAGTVWLMRSRTFRESPTMAALGPLVDRRLGPNGP